MIRHAALLAFVCSALVARPSRPCTIDWNAPETRETLRHPSVAQRILGANEVAVVVGIGSSGLAETVRVERVAQGPVHLVGKTLAVRPEIRPRCSVAGERS